MDEVKGKTQPTGVSLYNDCSNIFFWGGGRREPSAGVGQVESENEVFFLLAFYIHI